MAALVQIMAWRRTGDKPLSEPKLVPCCTDVYMLSLAPKGGGIKMIYFFCWIDFKQQMVKLQQQIELERETQKNALAVAKNGEFVAYNLMLL